MIDVNRVAGVRLAKAERPHLQVPTADQLVALIAEARGMQWAVPLLLAATTGMRRSEVLALRWADVDLDADRIRVVASLQWVRVDGAARLEFFDGKTDRGRRPIALPALAVVRLRKWRVDQAERRLRLGPSWSDYDLVGERGDGRPAV